MTLAVRWPVPMGGAFMRDLNFLFLFVSRQKGKEDSHFKTKRKTKRSLLQTMILQKELTLHQPTNTKGK